MISSSEYDSSSEGSFTDSEEEEIRQDLIRKNMNPRFRGHRRFLSLEENATEAFWALVSKINSKDTLRVFYHDPVANQNWTLVINTSYTDENLGPIVRLSTPPIILEVFPYKPTVKQLGRSLHMQQKTELYLHLIPGDRSYAKVQTRKLSIGLIWQCAAQYHNQKEQLMSESEYFSWGGILEDKFPLITLYNIIFSMFESSERARMSLLLLSLDKLKEKDVKMVKNLPRILQH